jgi:hypothetical protein
MPKMIKREISLLKNFILPITLVVAILYFRFYYIENPDRIIQKRESYEVLIDGAKKLKKIWHEGDIRGDLKNGKLDCHKEFKDFQKVDSTFFRCNLRFLECVLRESLERDIIDFPSNIYPLKQEGNKYTKVVVRSNMEGPKIPNYGVQIHLGYGGKSLKVIFEDTCRETIIPPRVYSYGVENNDWRWDNLGRLMVIDKYLVTNNDISEWNPNFSFKNLSYPATKLKFEEMQNYCLWKGKQVSQAHIFDAATFFPGNLKNINPKKIFKSPYPWTRIKMSSFLFSAQRYADFIFEDKYCNQIYSNECLGKIPFEDFQFRATTWLGLSEVLGGPMEFMRNPIDAKENLFASSYHFPVSSLYHQLGKRSFWDGLGFSWDHFSLEEKPVGENGLVGFRCMRSISNAK